MGDGLWELLPEAMFKYGLRRSWPFFQADIQIPAFYWTIRSVWHGSKSILEHPLWLDICWIYDHINSCDGPGNSCWLNGLLTFRCINMINNAQWIHYGDQWLMLKRCKTMTKATIPVPKAIPGRKYYKISDIRQKYYQIPGKNCTKYDIELWK